MDNLGSLVMSPIIKTIQNFNSDSALVSLGALSDSVWVGLHEFQHAFTDSGNALVRKKAITQPQLEHILDFIRCLDKSRFTYVNSK